MVLFGLGSSAGNLDIGIAPDDAFRFDSSNDARSRGTLGGTRNRSSEFELNESSYWTAKQSRTLFCKLFDVPGGGRLFGAQALER